MRCPAGMDPHQLDELILKIGMLILDARLADGGTTSIGNGGAGGGAGDGGTGGPLTPTSHDRQFAPFGSVPTVSADAVRAWTEVQEAGESEASLDLHTLPRPRPCPIPRPHPCPIPRPCPIPVPAPPPLPYP